MYNIRYKGLAHILNVELQTDEDKTMHLRLLQYHVNLHAKYEKPVLSVILYPFEQNVPVPPYKEMSGDEALQPALLRKLIRDLQQVPDETAVIRAFKTVKQGAEGAIHKEQKCLCSGRRKGLQPEPA